MAVAGSETSLLFVMKSVDFLPIDRVRVHIIVKISVPSMLLTGAVLT
jgi:hypothetical protein